MKELNEMELREVEGGKGIPLSLFFTVGSTNWITAYFMEVAAGIEDGWKENKL